MMGHCGVVLCQRRSGFLFGQLDDFQHAEVAMEFAVHDEDAAPDDMAGLRNACDGAASEAEIHRWLALAGGASESADQVRGRNRTRNQQNPDISINAVAFVMLAPAQVMQRVFRSKPEFTPESVGHQAVKTGAFVHFVEVRHRLAREQNATGSRTFHRRAIRII